jgi:hypothetical protein
VAGVARFVASSLAPAAQRFAPQAAAGLLRQVLEIAIDGYQRFPGAEKIAENKLSKTGNDPQLAIDAVIDQHIRLAGVQGFVTGLGGLITLPVSLPANLTGIAIVQTRMVAAIAHLRGYDLDDPRVRTAVITCLLGEDGVADRLKKSSLVTSPLAIATAPRLRPGAGSAGGRRGRGRTDRPDQRQEDGLDRDPADSPAGWRGWRRGRRLVDVSDRSVRR